MPVLVVAPPLARFTQASTVNVAESSVLACGTWIAVSVPLNTTEYGPGLGVGST